MRSGWRVFLLGLALLLGVSPARALSPALQLRLAQGEGDARVAALHQAVLAGDRRLGAYLQALLDGRVRIQGNQVRVAAPGEAPAAEGDEPMLNNRLRREFENALAALDLLAPEPDRRAQALQVLADQPDPARLPLLERARAVETVPALQQRLDRLLAAARLSAPEPAQRLRAAQSLAQAADPGTRALLL